MKIENPFTTGSIEYCMIPIQESWEYEPDILILDTNILIDIERFFNNPQKFASENEGKRFKSLMSFLSKYHKYDMIPGFGLAEACWRRLNNKINLERFSQMEFAVSTVLSWPVEKLIAHYAKPEQHINSRSFSDFKWEYLEKGLLPCLLGSYCILLKVVQLEKKRQQERVSKRMELYRELVEWANNQLGFFAGYEIQLGTDLLLNSGYRSYTEKILKLKKEEEILDGTWTTTWDLLFMRCLDLAFAGKLDGQPHKPMLVTADANLAELRKRCNLVGLIQDTDSLGIVEMYGDFNFTKKEQEEFEQIYVMTKNYQQKRVIDFLVERKSIEISKVKNLIRDLEQEISGKTSHITLD